MVEHIAAAGKQTCPAMFVLTILLLIGCARAPEAVRLDAGLAEQIFSPRLAWQESGELYCQWVEFHTDSIGGAGTTWDEKLKTFSRPESFDFMNRRWVQCIPELDRFRFANHGTATLVAHSCIQESFIVFRDSTGKREAAWLAAPAVMTYPIEADTLFLILYESPLERGLISVWLERAGRELSRDTLEIPSPDFAAAGANGVTMVKSSERAFHIYQMGRLCSWADSMTVARMYPAKQQIGTDYFMSGGDLFIVSGYRRPDSREIEFETHVLNGTRRESQHSARAKRESLGEYVAFRAVPSGGEFPYLLALESEPEHMRLSVLGLGEDGYWSRITPRAEVSPTIQEFSAVRHNDQLFAAYTAATSETLAAANACYYLQYRLE